MAPPQSKLDKWFMRTKDTLLFVAGVGGLVWGLLANGVRIVGLPAEVDAIAASQKVDQDAIVAMNNRVLIMETNFKYQKEVLDRIDASQGRMWNRINRTTNDREI